MAGFILVVLIAAIVISLAMAHHNKTNRAWSEAARRLGLAHRPGGFMSSPTLVGQVKGMRVVVEVMTRVGHRAFLREVEHIGAGIHGEIRGHPGTVAPAAALAAATKSTLC